MTQPEKQKRLELCIQKLKRASGFAEAMSAEPVRPETMTTLWQLSSEALSEITALRSIAAGNEPPRAGS